MISHSIQSTYSTPSRFLRSQRPESSSTSLFDLAASAVFFIPSTSFHVCPDRTSLPPSLAIMPVWPSLTSPITRLMSSQSSTPHGRLVFLRPPVQSPHSNGLTFSAVSPVAFYLSLVLLISAPTKSPPVTTLLELEAATIPMNSIAQVVQLLLSVSVESSARVVAFDDLLSPSYLSDWELTPD